MERRRLECEPYIEHICDSIRRDIKLEAIEGRVVYQIFRRYRTGPQWKNRDLSNERLEKPHYVTAWNVECRVDVTKDDFVYNPRENEFWIRAKIGGMSKQALVKQIRFFIFWMRWNGA